MFQTEVSFQIDRIGEKTTAQRTWFLVRRQNSRNQRHFVFKILIDLDGRKSATPCRSYVDGGPTSRDPTSRGPTSVSKKRKLLDRNGNALGQGHNLKLRLSVQVNHGLLVEQFKRNEQTPVGYCALNAHKNVQEIDGGVTHFVYLESDKINENKTKYPVWVASWSTVS